MKKKWKLIIAIVISVIVITGVIILWEAEKQAERNAEMSRRLLGLSQDLSLGLSQELLLDAFYKAELLFPFQAKIENMNIDSLK